MLARTRKNREIFLRTSDLRTLTEKAKEELCQKLCDFSVKNTQQISFEYLLKRLTTYSILCLVTSGEHIVGFGFADDRSIKVGKRGKFPLIHFGLMIIDKDWRGERISRFITTRIVKHVVKKVGPKIFLTGFAISAKCSSPVSFYRLQQGSLRIGFPKFDSKGNLNSLSRTRFGKLLSRSISEALNLGDIDNYVILNSNSDSGFKLTQEQYVVNSSYEERVLSFFNKNVIPHHEVLFISYAHPILAI